MMFNADKTLVRFVEGDRSYNGTWKVVDENKITFSKEDSYRYFYITFNLETFEGVISTEDGKDIGMKVIPDMTRGLMKKTQSIKTEFDIPMRLFMRASKKDNI